MPSRIHIIGRKNSGKTTLITELIAHLTAIGYKVGTIKHTHHQHELDAPGKDSHRHREAGAEVVGILSRSMNAVFWPTNGAEDRDRYSAFEPMFEQCDFVLVEGDSQTDAPKIEVWRQATGSEPLMRDDESILGLVTDDAIETTLPVLSRADVPSLATWLLESVSTT